MRLPYEGATRSADQALNHVKKMLRAFDGVDRIMTMENVSSGEMRIVFDYKGRRVEMPLRTQGYLDLLKDRKPYTPIEKLRGQAERAVWSCMIDWLKASLTMTELGVTDFEEHFLAHFLTDGGKTVFEAYASKLLLTEGRKADES